MVAFAVDLAGSQDPAPHQVEIEGDIVRNFESGEQPRHGGPPLSLKDCSERSRVRL